MTRLDALAQGAHDFLNHKTTLIIMTLVVAACTATFAFSYGGTFNAQYAILFFVALVALTFHFTKYFHPTVIAILRAYAITGLVVLSLFVAVAAWLNVATSTSDSGLADLNERIETKKDELAATETERVLAALRGTEAPPGSKSLATLQAELGALYKQRQALNDGSTTYQQGNMAVFGHLRTVTGWHQHQVDLLVMWLAVSVLLAMELTMGYAITAEDDKQGKP